MITWTTPSLVITIKGVHLENVEFAVTVSQGGTSYTFVNPEVDYVSCNTILTVDMTQEQTSNLKPGMAKIQVNWTDGFGHRNATAIKNVVFGDNLLKEVL